MFVDFDNIYLGLRSEYGEDAAARFATEASRWLSWFESGMESNDDPANAMPARRILSRRCYLNPRSFGRFRHDFVTAGFEIIDCPPLTSRGKTSADVRMLIDILDYLNLSDMHFDEFFILSADADFTPVFFRLRSRDRRVVLLAVGPAAAAYKAACDVVVDTRDFLVDGVGLELEREMALPYELATEIADRFYQYLMNDLNAPLAPSDAVAILKQFSEFRSAGRRWFGYGNLHSLCETIVASDGRLQLIGNSTAWEIGSVNKVPQVDEQLRYEVSRMLHKIIETSEGMIDLGSAREFFEKQQPEVIRGSWFGHGSFENWIRESDPAEFEIIEDDAGDRFVCVSESYLSGSPEATSS